MYGFEENHKTRCECSIAFIIIQVDYVASMKRKHLEWLHEATFLFQSLSLPCICLCLLSNELRQYRVVGSFVQQNKEVGSFVQQNKEVGSFVQQNKEVGNFVQQRL